MAGITQFVQTGIAYSFQDYLELVEWTGKAIRDDKRGFIDSESNGSSLVLHYSFLHPDPIRFPL